MSPPVWSNVFPERGLCSGGVSVPPVDIQTALKTLSSPAVGNNLVLEMSIMTDGYISFTKTRNCNTTAVHSFIITSERPQIEMTIKLTRESMLVSKSFSCNQIKLPPVVYESNE